MDDPLIHLDQLCPKEYRRANRRNILSRYGGFCIYCDEPNAVTIDHVIPKSHPNSSEAIWNKFPCCAECNGSKSNQHWYQWYRKQPFYNPDSVAKIKEWVIE